MLGLLIPRYFNGGGLTFRVSLSRARTLCPWALSEAPSTGIFATTLRLGTYCTFDFKGVTPGSDFSTTRAELRCVVSGERLRSFVKKLTSLSRKGDLRVLTCSLGSTRTLRVDLLVRLSKACLWMSANLEVSRCPPRDSFGSIAVWSIDGMEDSLSVSSRIVGEYSNL